VSYRLVFGRFLEFSTNVEKLENLTEGRFRGLWQGTKGNERERFEQVLACLGQLGHVLLLDLAVRELTLDIRVQRFCPRLVSLSGIR
jgi:hypothetical protein